MAASTSWSRRSLLVLAAAGAGAAVLAGPLGTAASTATSTTASGSTTRAVTGLRRDHWTPLVGKKVAVDGPAGRVRVTVIGVEDLRSAQAGDAGCFAVELRSAGGPAVTGLCPVTIPGRGVTTLLVSPVERAERHRTSEIIVNNPAR